LSWTADFQAEFTQKTLFEAVLEAFMPIAGVFVI
jgi:hypothetical protein